MTTELTWFLLGFMSAFALSTALVFVYLYYARRRVRSIQKAIASYQEASKIIHDAARDIYGKKP